MKSYSDVFETAPAYALELTDVTQEGDQFRVDFKAANTGNADAEDGTKVELRLVGLYGDLDSDRYGNLETGVLYSKDITSELKAKTLLEKVEGIDKYALPQDTVYEGDVLVDIPASVFRYCGYDAIELVVTDANGSVVEESNQQLVRLAEPMNLKLNSGSTISLSAGGSQQVALDFDSNVFLDKGNVVYSVADPSIATVTEEPPSTAASRYQKLRSHLAELKLHAAAAALPAFCDKAAKVIRERGFASPVRKN